MRKVIPGDPGPLGFTSKWETKTGHVTCELLHCVHPGKNYHLNVTVNLA